MLKLCQMGSEGARLLYSKASFCHFPVSRISLEVASPQEAAPPKLQGNHFIPYSFYGCTPYNSSRENGEGTYRQKDICSSKKEFSRLTCKRARKILSWAGQAMSHVVGRAVWLRHAFRTESFGPVKARMSAGTLNLSC